MTSREQFEKWWKTRKGKPEDLGMLKPAAETIWQAAYRAGQEFRMSIVELGRKAYAEHMQPSSYRMTAPLRLQLDAGTLASCPMTGVL